MADQQTESVWVAPEVTPALIAEARDVETRHQQTESVVRRLTKAEREVLIQEVPEWARWRDFPDDLIAVVESLLAERMADAWDEGYKAGARPRGSSPVTNPHRKTDEGNDRG